MDCATQPAAVVAPLQVPRTLQPGETTTTVSVQQALSTPLGYASTVHSRRQQQQRRRRPPLVPASCPFCPCIPKPTSAGERLHAAAAATYVPRHRAPVRSGRPTPSTRPRTPAQLTSLRVRASHQAARELRQRISGVRRFFAAAAATSVPGTGAACVLKVAFCVGFVEISSAQFFCSKYKKILVYFFDGRKLQNYSTHAFLARSKNSTRGG